MASDGEIFRVSIPSKNKFLCGPVAQERASSKPIEKLRPQHLLDALLWPEVRKEESVTLREYNDENSRYYVLTVLRGGYQVEVLREIWFDRADLLVSRLQTFGPKGLLLSDVHLANWEPIDNAAGQSAAAPVVLIVGLTSGLLTETAKRIEGIGADIMLQPPASSIFLGFSGSPMPIKIGEKLAELKYVQSVAPALLQFSSTGGVDVVYGIDPDSFRSVSGGFVILEGHDMESPDDLLVDDWAAKAKHISVGDTYNLLNHDWHVAAIIEHGKGARLFVPLGTLQDLVGTHDTARSF